MNHLDKLLQELERFDPGWIAHREVLQESRYKIEDLSFTARDYAVGSDFSPERLEQVNQRLYSLEKLIKKYGSSCREIIEFLNTCTIELQEMLSHSESAARLSEQLAQQLDFYQQCAHSLSDKRRQDSGRLAHEIRKEFVALAMEQMEMRVHFHTHDESETGVRVPSYYGLNGMDHVEFLLAPNKGEEYKPLARIASGGELSRIMLAIKSICGNEEKDRTLVFDEVDTGIGGRVAEAVGKRLRDISNENQVLCVTHLPQIAAFADHHFSVRKEIVNGRTETIVESLNESERIQELSRMLGGETITPATRRYAVEMLDRTAKSAKAARL